MDFKLLIKSAKDAFQDSPILVVLAVVGMCVAIYLVVDAHRCKKKRPRHRWK